MAKLPKAIIKKYGITKKAWSVFKRKKKSRSSSPKKRVKRRRSSTMARRRKARKSVRRTMGSVATRNLMGAAVAVGYDAVISPMIPVQGTAKNLLELAGGIWLGKRKGILGAGGKTLTAINSYELVKSLAGGLKGGGLGGLLGGNGSANGNGSVPIHS